MPVNRHLFRERIPVGQIGLVCACNLERRDARRPEHAPVPIGCSKISLSSPRTVFQDGREVKTKGRKTFISHFFPVGPKAFDIVTDYIAMLTDELRFGPNDPLFPSTLLKQATDRGFAVAGLTRTSWRSTGPSAKSSGMRSPPLGCPMSTPTPSGKL